VDSAFHIFLFFSKLFHLFQIFFLLFWCCFLCHLGLSIFYASTCNIVSHNFFLMYPDVCFSFLAVMHRLQLIHTDLKPENILLVSSDYVKLPDPKDGSFSRKLPKSSAIKLIDFGSTAYHHQNRSYIVSTRHYRAPEVILGHGWSYPCDIWSIGCILIELCSGETLFQTHENLEHLAMMERVLGPLPQHMLERADQHAEKYIRRGRLNWPEGATTRESIRAVLKLPRLQNLVMQHVDHSAGDLIDLLKRLLAYEPSSRLTAEEALSHGFFTRHGNRRSLWHPWFWRSASHVASSKDMAAMPSAIPLCHVHPIKKEGQSMRIQRQQIQPIIQMISELVLVEVEACMLWLTEKTKL